MEKAGYSRMVLLAREGMQVTLLPEFMEDDISVIWCRIGKRSRKPMHIGGVYREHKLPDQGEMSNDELLRRQRDRWG